MTCGGTPPRSASRSPPSSRVWQQISRRVQRETARHGRSCCPATDVCCPHGPGDTRVLPASGASRRASMCPESDTEARMTPEERDKIGSMSVDEVKAYLAPWYEMFEDAWRDQ